MPPYIKNTLLNFFSFFLIAVSLYIFISLVSYDISDSGFFNKNSSSNINNMLSKGINPDKKSWDQISKIAFRTFVPESEESRAKGAGGGDAND